ncbi:MAG TPA: protein translocase subunit SecD, partial [Alphaproteobacteria bacterium]|nr:protein translocase subunit SecD [Alphaproteobacteria bacterium]
MQKNLLYKTLFIIAVLLAFLFGIFGIPKSWTGQGLKESMLSRIRLGLDLKGGMHLVLQVMVDEAVSADSDRAVELLREELQKAKTPFSDISKPDFTNQPERIVVKGLGPDGSSQLRSIVTDKLPEYDVTGGAEGTWNVVMKPSAISDLQNRTVEKSIEAIRRRVDTLGVSEPTIQRQGMGTNQILVQLPGVDDPAYVKEIIKSTARLEMRQVFYSPEGFPDEQSALAMNAGILPPNTVLMHGKSVTSRDGQDRVYIVGRVPIVGGEDV